MPRLPRNNQKQAKTKPARRIKRNEQNKKILTTTTALFWLEQQSGGIHKESETHLAERLIQQSS